MSNLTAALDELIAVRDALYATINDTTKSGDIRSAALGEYDEVAFRVRSLLARDLENEVAELTPLAAEVKAAGGELKAVLAAAASATQIVEGVTGFLKKVDDLIDKAKPLLALL